MATDAPVDMPCRQDVIDLFESTAGWEAAVTTTPSLALGWCDCVLDKDKGWAPLHVLAIRAPLGNSGSPGITAALVQKLVARGGRVLAPDAQNRTALHIAATRGVSAAVAALCGVAASRGQLNALLEAVDADDWTALVAAEAQGQIDVARTLRSWGAGRGDAGDAATTTLGECAQPLLDAVLASDVSGLRDAIVTSSNGIADCVVPRDSQGRTLLHFASTAAGHRPPGVGSAIVQLLLEFGANASRCDDIGELPIFAAVRVGESEVAGALLGASPPGVVNVADVRGRTALFAAASRGALACVRLLLLSGALPDIVDDLGLTPLDMAERGGHTEVADVIQTAMADPLGYYAARREGGSNGGGGAVVAMHSSMTSEPETSVTRDSQRPANLQAANSNSSSDRGSDRPGFFGSAGWLEMLATGPAVGLIFTIACCSILLYFYARKRSPVLSLPAPNAAPLPKGLPPTYVAHPPQSSMALARAIETVASPSMPPPPLLGRVAEGEAVVRSASMPCPMMACGESRTLPRAATIAVACSPRPPRRVVVETML